MNFRKLKIFYETARYLNMIKVAKNIEKLILENKIYFVFVEGEIYCDEIIKEVQWKDELVFICGDKNNLKNFETAPGIVLGEQKLIMRERGSGTRENIESFLKKNKIEVNIFLELGNTEAIKRTVEANL